MYVCESWTIKKAESWRIDAFELWCRRRLLSPLDSKIKPVNPKGSQPWKFIGRTDAEAEVPILWPPDVKSWLIRKDPDTGKDWEQEEKGWQKMRWLDGVISTMDVSTQWTLAQWTWVLKGLHAAFHGIAKSWTQLFSGSSDGKVSACNAEDLGSIPGLGRSPEGGHSNTHQYSCLENPHGQRSLAGYIFHGITKSRTRLSD